MTGPVTRFAPSPTGMLHIGGARTALFNWLYARANAGTFRLRIEDTDRQRSTPEAVDRILRGLEWLGLEWDGVHVSQHTRADRHAEIVQRLLETGHAYRCYATQDEIATFRAEVGMHAIFISPWRDRTAVKPSAKKPFVVRLRIPDHGVTVVEDAVFGTITWPHDVIEDLVILRTDGTPTYNLAVVVDDHDMAVSDVIRGDDHLANTPKQVLVYEALGWPLPRFAHLPLIHDEDGRKLSKRNGFAGLETYQDQGYLPEAVRNYLSRLGWSHGDDEFYTTEQAIRWFGIDGIRKSPARLDHKKLASVAQRHMAALDPDHLRKMIVSYLELRGLALSASHENRLMASVTIFQKRATTLRDLVEGTPYLGSGLLDTFDPDSRDHLAKTPESLMGAAIAALEGAIWEREALSGAVRAVAADNCLAFGKVAAPLRAAMTGMKASPGILDLMLVLGKTECLQRFRHAAETLCASGPLPSLAETPRG